MTDHLKKVMAEIESALQKIKATGVKGHSFTGGLAIARYAEKQQVKHFIHAGKDDVDLAEQFKKAKIVHDIEKIEKIVTKEDLSVVHELSFFYLMVFKIMLLRKRSLQKLSLWAKKNNIPKDMVDKYFRSLFNKFQGKNLKSEQQMFHTLTTVANGGVDIKLAFQDIVGASQGGISEYLREWFKVKEAFKEEHLVEKLESAKLKDENSIKSIAEHLSKEYDADYLFIKRANLHLVRTFHTYVNSLQAIREAAQQHEIPLEDLKVETKLHEGIIELEKAFMHSLNIILNQIDTYIDQTAKTLKKAA